MNIEELMQDNNNNNNNNNNNDIPYDDTKRNRLSSIVAGGRSKQYLGQDLQVSEIDKLSEEQINKLYSRYESRLGANMTKTLGNSFINLYVIGVSKYFNITNTPKLIEDLKEDPFINNALTNLCCEMYYKYGMYLAPITALLTTARYIDFNEKKKDDIEENNNINENKNIDINIKDVQ
jgi:hypothetical protein